MKITRVDGLSVNPMYLIVINAPILGVNAIIKDIVYTGLKRSDVYRYNKKETRILVYGDDNFYEMCKYMRNLIDYEDLFGDVN
jgi:hypothetical protein